MELFTLILRLTQVINIKNVKSFILWHLKKKIFIFSSSLTAP